MTDKNVSQTQIVEYKTTEIDIETVLFSYRKYGAMVTFKCKQRKEAYDKQMSDICGLDPYTRKDGSVGIIARVKGCNPRDLTDFDTILIRV